MSAASTRAGLHSLDAHGLTAGYGPESVLRGIDLDIPPGGFTVIVGPNACGKSTLLRTLGRMLAPRSGAVLLDGALIHSLPTKTVARTLGLLPQSPVAPEGLVVSDLVARGRYPHQRLLRPWTDEDQEAVLQAMETADVTDLAERVVDELSGGQRQRVWLAMALAQRTPLLLLDEPTTYLDIAHQIDVLDLCDDLHRSGQTIVAVLHDLNLAFRYATHVVVMSDGRIAARGAPEDIVDANLIGDVFDLPCEVRPDPQSGTPMVIPLTRTARAGRIARAARTAPPSPSSRSSS
jgi:iron complex transport system ATP-binding protein